MTLAPENVEYPVILPGFDAPKLRVYPRHTVVAEKTETLTSFGIANSRMNMDFHSDKCGAHFNSQISSHQPYHLQESI